MAQIQTQPGDNLSPWWKLASIVTMVFSFAVLILLTVKGYQDAPPIPARVVDPAGTVLFTADDVAAGQQMFLRHVLMDNGTIWGHGGYLGPDFSVQYLHNWALDLADRAARERFNRGYAELTPADQATIDGGVALSLRQSRFDASADTLALSAADAESFNRQIDVWTKYFLDPSGNGGLPAGMISDQQELRQLTAFFAWTAWASVAERPGHSYTSNFPYDPPSQGLRTLSFGFNPLQPLSRAVKKLD